MKLSKYDEKCIQLITTDGTVYEGACTYNNSEYGECVFGRAEESLEIFNFLFYKSEIKYVKELDSQQGLFGHFNTPYGTVEKLIVEDGLDGIEDALDCEQDENTIRLLRYLNVLKRSGDPAYTTIKDGVEELVDGIIEYNTNPEVLSEANNLKR